MSRRPAGRALAAALVFSAAATASGRQAQKPAPVPDQQPIRTEVTFVRVDVYPTRDGRPVEGLMAGTSRFANTACSRPSRATARMLDRAGNELHVPVRIGQKTDNATGQHWITADVVLGPLAAGDYAIEQAPLKMEKVITAIRVTR